MCQMDAQEMADAIRRTPGFLRSVLTAWVDGGADTPLSLSCVSSTSSTPVPLCPRTHWQRRASAPVPFPFPAQRKPRFAREPAAGGSRSAEDESLVPPYTRKRLFLSLSPEPAGGAAVLVALGRPHPLSSSTEEPVPEPQLRP